MKKYLLLLISLPLVTLTSCTGHFAKTFNIPGRFRVYAPSEGFHGVGMYGESK